MITIIGHSPFPEQVSLGFSGGVYCYYMICGYMVKKGYFRSIRTYWLVIIIICSILAGTGIQLWAYSNGVLYTIWRDNPFILFASVAFFEAFSRIRQIKHASLFKRLASYSFGVYLVHVLIRVVTIDYVLHMPVVRPVRILILWVITVVFSYLLSWLISLIPKAGNYIIYRK